MRVWELKGAFGLDRLALAERPDAEPGPGRVRLRMRAASVNYRDLVVVAGEYGRHITTPLVPLSDGVGEVVAVGEGTSRVALGDRVCPMFFQRWIAGPPTPDTFAGTLGGPLDGALAESMVLGEDGVAKVPEHLSDEEAACLPCAALTAWSALVTEGGLAPGQVVLVQGTGGVSLFALMFAKMLGAEVIVTSSSDEKLARARELGADHTVNYRTTPAWEKTAKELTGGVGVDHVVEVGGADTLERSVKAVRLGGRISLIGVLSGAAGSFGLPLVVMRQVCMQGITVGSRTGFEAMVRAMAHHQTRPTVDRVFGFDEAPEALAYLSEGRHFGKVCIGF